MKKRVFYRIYFYGDRHQPPIRLKGAWNTDGKGSSVWDHFAKITGKTFKGSTGDTAAGHYEWYKEDVALMAEMGLTAYRFSVSWPRIFPSFDYSSAYLLTSHPDPEDKTAFEVFTGIGT
ncbi:hypothetical protein AUL54_09030 [Bacillus sp. SDLI1]|nr:hypothetical protein AUL54_09030 [Bacillus sp. SDLI1]